MSGVKNNYHRWGGIFARKSDFELLEQQLDDLLDLVDIIQITSPNLLSSEIAHNQWLLHRHPYDDFVKCTIALPSDYVQGRIVEVLDSKCLPLPNDSILRGIIFEGLVLNRILSQKFIEVKHWVSGRSLHSVSAQRLHVESEQEYSNDYSFQNPK